MRKLGFWAIALAVIAFCSSAAQADSVTTYTSASTWQAAVGSTTTEDFADSTLATGLSATFGSNASIGSGVLTVIGQLSTIPRGLDLLITFSNTSTTDVFIAGTDPEFNGFFGVVSNGATISSVTLKGPFFGNGESFTLDNLQFSTGTGTGDNGGPSTGVPEPSTLLLSALGLGGLAALKRTRIRYA